MKRRWNCAGGDTIVLNRRDSLDEVPESHRDLITAAIRDAFKDPIAYFEAIGARCRFGALALYLNAHISSLKWVLRLHTNDYGSQGTASFAFKAEHVIRAEFAPSESSSALQQLPTEITELYSLLDLMDWSTYGGAGGLYQSGEHAPLTSWPVLCGSAVDPATTFLWGSTECGDQFIYTKDNRAGMLCHENGHVHLIGTVAETIDWICNELLNNRTPQFDYGWLKSR
jgi:hypothetical protein